MGMADVHIHEVHTDMEITDSAGAMGPTEIKKLVAKVMEHLKAQQEHEELRRRDDTLTDHAYASEGDE
jgi:hypothetical protein